MTTSNFWPTAARRALAALAILAAAPAAASDYYDQCSSSDGQLQISGGELIVEGYNSGEPVPYETLAETVLRETEGYCLSNTTGDQQFGFSSRLSAQLIRVDLEGHTVETAVLCEMIGDGLPAALGCDKQVMTKDVSTFKK